METNDMCVEMGREGVELARRGERVIGVREACERYDGDAYDGLEYLVKWQGLDYKVRGREGEPSRRRVV